MGDFVRGFKEKKLVLPKQKIKSIKNGVKKIKNKKRSQ